MYVTITIAYTPLLDERCGSVAEMMRKRIESCGSRHASPDSKFTSNIHHTPTRFLVSTTCYQFYFKTTHQIRTVRRQCMAGTPSRRSETALTCHTPMSTLSIIQARSLAHQCQTDPIVVTADDLGCPKKLKFTQQCPPASTATLHGIPARYRHILAHGDIDLGPSHIVRPQ